MTQSVNLFPCAISDDEAAAMAALLARRHGASAAGVARYFALENEAYRDAARAAAWRRVEALLRR